MKVMWTFIKHKFTKKDKLFAQWGAVHVAIALVVGVALTIWLYASEQKNVQGRMEELKQTATVAASTSGALPPGAANVGGPFTLINQDGKVTRDSDFSGKYLLVYFGYTNCPDMCPTGLQSISRALDQLHGDSDKVQPLFITVDPLRDTPDRLKEYDSAFHPKIVGLTGTAEQIAAVAKEYQVYYQKGEGDEDYEVDHSSAIYLMNPSGKLLTTFDEEVDPKIIVSALQKAWSASP